MNRGRAALLVLAAAVACAAASSAARAGGPTTQDITVTMSDNTQLACGLTLPAGSPPSDGWPGVLLFPGTESESSNFKETHAAMDAIAVARFAPAGLASLACDERGTGASNGTFDLAGPTDVQDVHDLFTWFAARPDVSDTKIGAFGISIGGAEVWNAAVAGVPFKAIVPDATWTNLRKVVEPYPFNGFGVLVASMISAPGDLAVRSSRGKLHTLAVPTLMVQGRQDLLFDIDQARVAYRLLTGPKRLYIGSTTHALPEITAWLVHYLAGGPAVNGGVEIPPLTFMGMPGTRRASVNLPGTATITDKTTYSSHAVRLTGGPFRTFGDGNVTIRYSRVWPGPSLPPSLLIVATVSLEGAETLVAAGWTMATASKGVLKIPLRDIVSDLPAGKPIVVRLWGTNWNGPAGAKLTATHVTATLSFLNP